MEYVIGCDVGSQGTKACLLTLDGTIAAEAFSGYGVDYPAPMWAEQPVGRWIDGLAACTHSLLASAGIRAEQVRAVGLATQVDGVVPIDAAGTALCPAIIWMDRRAAAQCEAVRSAVDTARVFGMTGLNLDASHVAPKIRWLAEQRPAVYAQAAYFLLPGSYLAYYLTGELAVDYSNASSTLLMDLHSRAWSPELCAMWQIDPARLAPVSSAAAPLTTLRPQAAAMLGLSSHTRVVVGCGDEHAACLGAGVVRPGLVADIAGTAEAVCMATHAPLFDPSGLIETHCHADPELWLLENPGFVSGGNLRWFREQFMAGDSSSYAAMDAGAAQIPAGADGVVFLPCLMGALAPTWNESARGVFFGFTLAHSRDHFSRAMLEGSAYAIHDVIAQMHALGLAPGELRVVGGGARSRLWNQIKADVTGLSVSVPEITETTALGAALLALVGIDACSTLGQACERVVRVRERFEPRPEAGATYDRLYALYRQVYFALLPAFDQAAKLRQALP